jgi:hypothetical protein
MHWRIKEVAAAISGHRKTGRSAAYRWLWENYETLSIGKTGRADWIATVAALRKIGIGDKPGEELKPDNVRKIWARVVADHKRQQGANAERHAPRPPAGAMPRAISQERTTEPFQIRPINSPKETP